MEDRIATRRLDYIVDLLVEDGFTEYEAIQFFGYAYFEYKKLEEQEFEKNPELKESPKLN